MSFVNKIFYKSLNQNKKINGRYQFRWSASSFFHRLDKNCLFNDSWIHCDDDRVIYAAVVYLSPSPEQNSGTVIDMGEKITVENVFNRLILYKSNYLHYPEKGFGENEKSRTTFTVFFGKIDLLLGVDH